MADERVVVAFDKFRGSATATALVDAVSAAIRAIGWQADGLPLADGGEGSINVVGGPNKTSLVTGPLGDPVTASWRLDGRTAYIEMAAASGLDLIGGAGGNDPMAADTTGTGELISHAIELGARKIYVLLGGSASTDGGFGAIRAMPPSARMKEIELIVAADVSTSFTDAARAFGAQKGATPSQVRLLTRRLDRLVQLFQDEYGVDVGSIPGAGAAGGLAGGLVALGGRIERGFDVLAEAAELDLALDGATLAITGEGYLDVESFNGKVVGGVAEWSKAAGVPVLAIVGARDRDVVVPEHVSVVSLSERFGEAASWSRTLDLAAEVAVEIISGR